MFEGSKPIPAAQNAQFSGKLEDRRFLETWDNDGDAAQLSEQLFGNVDTPPHENGSAEALRTLNWSELSARLSAARELRTLLRRDASRSNDDDNRSFADAAADYFRTRGGDEECNERGVNPVALEHCKGSPGMVPIETKTRANKPVRGPEDQTSVSEQITNGNNAGPVEGPIDGSNDAPNDGDTRED